MRTNFFSQKLNWTLVGILAFFYLIFELLYALKVDYFVSLQGGKIPFHVYGAYAIDWVLVTVYMVLISIHTSYLLEKKISWSKIIPLHLFFSILISLVIRLVIDAYQMIIGVLPPNEYTKQLFMEGLMHNIDVNYLIYTAMIFIIYVFYYLDQIKASRQQKHLLENQLLDARIKMLTTQLQPHFLFNTLNTISSLIDINAEKAQDTLADLSDFLRQILFNIDSNFVPVQKELEILEPYLNILRARFHERITIQTHIQDKLRYEEIPTMILQPLVENAVKHGSFTVDSRLLVEINVFEKNNRITIEVINSGQLELEKAVGEEGGMGITNIKNRLQNIYGESATFTLKNAEENKVISCVEMPLNL